MTGNVSLTVDGGTATTQLLTSGSSTFTLTSPNAGDHSLSASYTAQGNFAASSAIGTLHVNQASQTITVTAPNPFPSNATYGASFTASATGGGSGNAVMIFGSGSCGGSGNDSALITMTSGTGSCTVTFNQMGNTNYSAASQVSKSVTALLAPQTIAFTDPATAPALSPDGQTLVFIGTDSRLWLRSLQERESKPLAGTESAAAPFWSPDQKWIAFFAAGRLRKIPAGGGVIADLCDAPISSGGAWSGLCNGYGRGPSTETTAAQSLTS